MLNEEQSASGGEPVNPNQPINSNPAPSPTRLSQTQTPNPPAVVVNQTPSPVKHSKFSKKLILILLALLVLIGIAGAGGYFFMNQNKTPEPIATVSPTPDPNEQVACTMEALICPDGTAVGREGPNCEFAACPASGSANTSGWKTYTNSKERISVNHPGDWKLDSDSSTDTIFEFNYPPTGDLPRFALFRNFAGDWCNGMPTAESTAKLSDGTSAKKWDCKQTIVLMFDKNNEELVLYADNVTEKSYATVNKVIDSIKFN